jgi:hypothetical protein
VAILSLLAFVIWLPFHRSQPRTDGRTMQELVGGFESRGVKVVNDHPRCSEANLYGLYVRGTREVVVCRRGDQSSTLRHEGWHLVQSLCLGEQQWLNNDEVEQRLTTQDRHELNVFVGRESWPREAEARVMAQLSPKSYFEAVDGACRSRLQNSDW